MPDKPSIEGDADTLSRITPIFAGDPLAQGAAAGGPPKPRTQTRKHINALLQQDWEDINQRLNKALQEIREIQEARSDIELIAKLSNIDLT